MFGRNGGDPFAFVSRLQAEQRERTGALRELARLNQAMLSTGATPQEIGLSGKAGTESGGPLSSIFGGGGSKQAKGKGRGKAVPQMKKKKGGKSKDEYLYDMYDLPGTDDDFVADLLGPVQDSLGPVGDQSIVADEGYAIVADDDDND